MPVYVKWFGNKTYTEKQTWQNVDNVGRYTHCIYSAQHK